MRIVANPNFHRHHFDLVPIHHEHHLDRLGSFLASSDLAMLVASVAGVVCRFCRNHIREARLVRGRTWPTELLAESFFAGLISCLLLRPWGRVL